MPLRRLILAALVLFLLTVMPASADNGPHGNYTATTDACAGCHRAHTARSDDLLLVGTSYDLCLTCHGTNGNGADTDVADGVYLQRDSNTESPDEGVVNRGLRGGGFIYTRMNTDWTDSASPSPVTSTHIWDDSTGTVWGSGDIGSGPGETISLTCTACHNPHGQSGRLNYPSYRILRSRPIGSGEGGTALGDENPKNYTINDETGKYFGDPYEYFLFVNIAEWCAQCHDRYLAHEGSGHTDSGDPIYAYRHFTVGRSCGCHDLSDPPTGNPEYRHSPTSCLTCHVAHGSSASMTGHSGNTPWPDGATSPNGNARSALLRVDNRGACQLCHDK